METITNNLESVLDYINGLDDADLVALHNEYCQSTNSSDDDIYENDEDFFITYFSDKMMDAIRAICYGEYNYTDKYVQFNGYANLDSFNYPCNKVDKDAIAEDILENRENYYGIELEEPEEEEEETDEEETEEDNEETNQNDNI